MTEYLTGPRRLAPSFDVDPHLARLDEEKRLWLAVALPAVLIEGIRFAADSPLEQRGFEPPVPLSKRVGLSGGTGSAAEAKGTVSRSSLGCSGLLVDKC
jgi:hypothetical protein